MKTKLLLIAIFIITTVNDLSSQEYHPMLNNSSWLINDWVSCCRPPEEKLISQGVYETIGSYVYTKFNDPFPSYDNHEHDYIRTIYLREDIDEQKVFKLVHGEERLLYDFSLNDGETIVQGDNTFTASVDAVEVEGGTRKRITLQSVEQYCGRSLTQIWIEGVGSNKHPFYPDFNMYNVCSSGGGYNIFTKCSFQNGNHVYGSNCTNMPGLGNEENLVSQKIEFYPNPFSTEMSITSKDNFENATLKLYNSVGQLVVEQNNNNEKTITLHRGNLSAGIYLVQLFQDGKILQTNKLVVTN